MMSLSSLFTIISVVLSFSLAQNGTQTFSCIDNYEELKTTLRDNTTDNIEKLLDTFYPPNESTVHSVLVTYCFETSNTTNYCLDNITYHWSSNALLLVVEAELLNALTLHLFDLISRNVTLMMQTPFCSTDINTNLLFTETLTTWIKSYGRSNFETNQGYAIYYDTERQVFVRNTYNIDHLRVSIVLWLALVTLSMTLILSGRLCSKSVSEKLEQTVEDALESAIKFASLVKGLKEIFIKSDTKSERDTKEVKNEDNNKDNEMLENTASETVVVSKGKKFFDHLTNIDKLLLYTVALVFFIVWDIVAYAKASRSIDWYIFFPFPIIFPIHFIMSIIITACTGISIVIISRKKQKKLQIYKFIKELFAALVLSLLIMFILFHGFWAIMMTLTYPDRLTSAALFIVPLYFPLRLAFKTFTDIVKIIWNEMSNLNKNKIKLYLKDGKSVILHDILSFVHNNFVQVVGYAFIVSFWTPLLAVLYFVSDFLLVITDIRKDPFKLFVFAVLLIIITYRMIKICEPTKKEKKKKEEVKNKDDQITPRSSGTSPRRIPPPVPPNKPKTTTTLQWPSNDEESPPPSTTTLQQYEDREKEIIYDTLSLESGGGGEEGGIDNTVYSLAGHEDFDD